MKIMRKSGLMPAPGMKQRAMVGQMLRSGAVGMKGAALPSAMPEVPMVRRAMGDRRGKVIVPLHKGGKGLVVPSRRGTGASTLLSYGNGPLLTSVEVITIFWGGAWNQSPTNALLPQINQFFDYILTSPHIDLLAQYSVAGKTIGHGSRTATFTDTGSEPGGGGNQVTDAQVQQEIQALINNGSVPAPNANTLYFVYLPPNVQLTGPAAGGGGSSCVDFCGYHWFISGTNPEIYYAAMPFPSCSGCLGGLSQIQALTSVSSHELCESITDPHPWTGWNSDQGEIGDICAWQTDVLGGFTVQKEWSNADGACVTQGAPGASWSGWEDRGGIITAGPAAASWASNRIDCFVKGTDNGVWHQWWDGANWNGWEPLGGVIDGNPAAVSWGPDRIDLFARGMDNGMWHMWWDGSSWNGWEPLGGIITAGPAVASWGPNRLDCFVKGTDNGLWHMWWDGSGWNGWEPLGGVIDGNPAAVSWGPNRIDVFARGMDNGMWHMWWDGSSWNGWEPLGGVIDDGPAAVSWGPGRIDCFARGMDNHMYHMWWG